MKKVLFIFTFLLTFSYVNAQENKFAAKRAAKAVAFILQGFGLRMLARETLVTIKQVLALVILQFRLQIS